MPTYCFRIEDALFDHLIEWCDLPGLDAACRHAASRASTLIREEHPRFARGEAWQMLVTDENGVACFSLDFTGVDPPSGGRCTYGVFAAAACAEEPILS